jgi:hypothetical protein
MTEEEILQQRIKSEIADAISVGVVYGRDNAFMPNEVLSAKVNMYSEKVMKHVREFLIP